MKFARLSFTALVSQLN